MSTRFRRLKLACYIELALSTTLAASPAMAEITASATSSTGINGNNDTNSSSGNTLNVTGTYKGIQGGLATGTANANGNTVTVTGSSNDTVSGGEAVSGTASHNNVTIGTTGNIIGGIVNGGKSKGNTDNNTTIIQGTTSNTVTGGWSELSGANENKIIIDGGIARGDIYGGRSGSAGSVSNNEVLIKNGNALGAVSKIATSTGDVYGGRSIGGTVDNNKVTITNSSIGDTTLNSTGSVYGGHNTNGNVTNSSVIIQNSSVNKGTSKGGDVCGGYADNGSVIANTVTLNNATVAGNVYGGYNNGTGAGNVTGNTVNLGGNTSITNAYGGFSKGTGNVFSGNTLNKSSDVAISQVQNFETIRFDYTGNAGITTLDTTVRGTTGTVKLDTGSNNVTFGGTLSGSGSIEKTGSGKLVLEGTGNYTGSSTITGGILEVTGTLGSGTYSGLLNNNGSLVLNQGTDQTLSGRIQGSGSLIQNGTGKLTLSGDNSSYSGSITINSGTLSVQEDKNAGTGTHTVSGGTLSLTGSSYNSDWTFTGNSKLDANTTFGGVISGSGNLDKISLGTLVLTGESDYSGTLTLSGGDLQIGNGGSFAGNIVNNTQVTFNHSGNSTYGGVISGTGSLTQQGGTLTLTGDNTYTGTTTVRNGTLKVGDGGLHGSVAGIIALENADVIFNSASDSTASLTGSGNMVKDGTGTLTLSGNNNHDNTTINNGTLSIGSDSNIGTGTNTLSGGTLLLTSNSYASHWKLSGHGSIETTADTTFDGLLYGTGGFNKTGTGTLILTQDNTYTGTTQVSAGDLQIRENLASNAIDINRNASVTFNNSNGLTYGGIISGAGSLTQQGGTLTLTGDNTYTGTTTVDNSTLQVGDGTTGSMASVGINLRNNANVVFMQSGSATYGGAITGTGSLTQEGGTLTLTGTSDYTGTTTINNGTLSIGSDNNIGTGTNTLSSSTLSLTGSSYVKNWVLSGNNTLDTGSTHTTFGGVFSGSDNLDKIGTGTLILTGNSRYSGTLTLSEGDLQMDNGGDFAGQIVNNTHVTFNRTGNSTYDGAISGTGSLTQQSGTLTLTGDNTFTGTTEVNAGSTLKIGNGGTGGSLVGTIDNHGDILFNRSGTSTHDSAVSGSGNLTKEGTGSLTLGGDVLQKNITVSGGTLNVAGEITATGAFSVGNGTTLGLQASSASTAIKAGSASIGTGVTLDVLSYDKKSGTYTLIQSGSAINGTFDIALAGGSKIQMPGDPATVDSFLIADIVKTNGDKELQITPKLVWDQASGAHGTFNVASLFEVANDLVDNKNSGAGSAANWEGTTLTKTGSGTLTLSGNNSYTGDTLVLGGTLAGNITSGTHLTVAAGATYDGTGADRTIGTLNGAGTLINGNSLTTRGGTFSGAISGTGTLTKTGTDTLVLSGDNTYAGVTTVDGGTLQIGDGGTTGSVFGNIVNNTNANVVFDRSNDATYGGVLSGNAGLTQNGTGTLMLTGANQYQGITEVLSGNLSIAGNGNISNALALHENTRFDTGGLAVALSRLDIYGSATYTGDLGMAGGQLNFYVPTTAGDGTTLLSVTGDAHIQGATVNVGINGTSSPLQTNGQIVLIDSASLTGSQSNTKSYGYGMHGVTLHYDFDIVTSGNQLLAIMRGDKPKTTEQSKALSEGFLSGITLVNQGADMMTEQGIGEAVKASLHQDFGVFSTVSGGKQRYNTGSHVDLKSFSLAAGLSRGWNPAWGHSTLGAFFGYGNGSYDTHNVFDTASVHGNGSLQYYGGGILERTDFARGESGHLYAEASGSAGELHNKYSNGDMRDSQGHKASYKTSSIYYGLHAAAGYVWDINQKTGLDLYTKYFWMRQEGNSTHLSTGDPVKFKETDSQRLRMGFRINYAMSQALDTYAGLAYEHEFDGRARATAYDHSIVAPTLKGDTGTGELGLSFRPSQTLSLGLKLQGYTGRREGVMGFLQMERKL